MINFNFNIIEAQRTSPGPITENTIEYVLVGGGAGGNGGDVGYGALGGEVVSGSFQVQHLTSFSWTVGQGGNGASAPYVPTYNSARNGTSSSIEYNSVQIAGAGGGYGDNVTTASSATNGADGFLSETFSEISKYGEGGGLQYGGGQLPPNKDYPFGTPVLPFKADAFQYTGGGGGRGASGVDGGDGADGVVQLRIYDPRHIWDWEYTATPIYSSSYDDGYTYIFFGSNGSLTFLGKKD